MLFGGNSSHITLSNSRMVLNGSFHPNIYIYGYLSSLHIFFIYFCRIYVFRIKILKLHILYMLYYYIIVIYNNKLCNI